MAVMAFRSYQKSKLVTVIVGCGRLGAHIANKLSEQGSGVVIIDSSREAFRRLSPSFNGIIVTGDAMTLSVLEEAALGKAQALVAVTNRDITNIMVAQMAKEIYKVPRVIVRLLEPDLECVFRNSGIETISPLLLSTNAALWGYRQKYIHPFVAQMRKRMRGVYCKRRKRGAYLRFKILAQKFPFITGIVARSFIDYSIFSQFWNQSFAPYFTGIFNHCRGYRFYSVKLLARAKPVGFNFQHARL